MVGQLAMQPLKISGRLRTLDKGSDAHDDSRYRVKFGDRPIDSLIAEQLPYGGYYHIYLRDKGEFFRTLSGTLDVFKVRKIVEYYHNDWRIEQEVRQQDYRVRLGGKAITYHIGKLFQYDDARTYYDRGCMEMQLVPLLQNAGD